MPYLNCPRCHLTKMERVIKLFAGDCPRCLGRDGIHIPLFASRLPYQELTNVGVTPPVQPSDDDG